MLNKRFKIIALALLAVLSSCDFKPEISAKFYTGTEPVVELDVTGMNENRLIISGISTYGYQDFPNTNDTLKAKYYSSNYSGDLVKIYTKPDSLSHSYTYNDNYSNSGVLKILDSDGLKISGDISNGISLKNIRQTPADKAILAYMDKLSDLKREIVSTYKETFNYSEYLQTHVKIESYIKNSVDSISLYDLIITYNQLAAKQGFLSQNYFGSHVFYNYDDASLRNNRFSDIYLSSVRKLPPISINDELHDYLLSETYKENPFFKKGNKPMLKIIIVDSYSNNEKLILEDLKYSLTKRFAENVEFLVIPPGDSYIDYEKLYSKSIYKTLLNGRPSKGYTQVNALQTTILDQENKVLLNTTADDNLELKIESILEYLENQPTFSL